MKILLIGASGFIGRNLSGVLRQAGHDIVPVSRHHGVDVSLMRRSEQWLPWLRGVEVVINAVGIIGESGGQGFAALHTEAPVALFDACLAAGVRRVIQISALGADTRAASAYHLSKRAADDYLRSLDLDWWVLRPALIYGRGGASSEMFQRLARLPIVPVIGDGRQPLQPVHIADVVATIVACMTSEQARTTLDIVGNEVVEYAHWLQRLRLAQGYRQGGVLHLPLWLVLLGAWAGQVFSPMLRTENIRMLVTGYRASPNSWNAFLGRRALDFSPALLRANAAEALGGQGSVS